MACPEMPDLENRPAYGGLDLAEKYDFTAFCAGFPPSAPGGVYAFRWWFWVAENAAKTMTTRGVNIEQWARDGWVTITPGDALDLELVLEDIAAIGKGIDYDCQRYGEAVIAEMLGKYCEQLLAFLLMQDDTSLAALVPSRAYSGKGNRMNPKQTA